MKKGTTEVEIAFTPATKNTSTCEVELRVSQFDFEPLKIRIVGTGKTK
jgi:hypothetical protein